MVFEPGIGNRKFTRGDVVIGGFRWIRLYNWRDRLSQYTFAYGESNGHHAGVHLNLIWKSLSASRAVCGADDWENVENLDVCI